MYKLEVDEHLVSDTGAVLGLPLATHHDGAVRTVKHVITDAAQ